MKKAPGAKASVEAQKARLIGMVMGQEIRKERIRTLRHLVALWVAVVITFIVAVL